MWGWCVWCVSWFLNTTTYRLGPRFIGLILRFFRWTPSRASDGILWLSWIAINFTRQILMLSRVIVIDSTLIYWVLRCFYDRADFQRLKFLLAWSFHTSRCLLWLSCWKLACYLGWYAIAVVLSLVAEVWGSSVVQILVVVLFIVL